jgi:hypothetical protein
MLFLKRFLCSPIGYLLAITLIFGLVTLIMQLVLFQVNPADSLHTVSIVNSYFENKNDGAFNRNSGVVQNFTHYFYNYDKCARLIKQKYVVSDLIKQKRSYLAELKRIEAKRAKLLKSIENLKADFDSLTAKTNNLNEQNYLVRSKLIYSTLRLNEVNIILNERINLIEPLKVLNTFNDTIAPGTIHQACSLETCVDMTACKPNQKLNVFIYKTYHDMPAKVLELIHSLNYNQLDISAKILRNVNQIDAACLVIILISKDSSLAYRQKLAEFLEDNKNRNFVFVNVEWLENEANQLNSLEEYLSPILVSNPSLLNVLSHKSFYASFHKYKFSAFNFHFSVIFNLAHNQTEQSTKRTYLISYHYCTKKLLSSNNSNLKLLNQSLSVSNNVLADLNCQGDFETICFSEPERAKILSKSKFTLIIPSLNNVNVDLAVRLVEALKYSTIPVLIDMDSVLPLSELIHWQDVVIRVPFSNMNRIVPILESVDRSDLASRQVKARNIYNTYFSSSTSQLRTLISLVQHRLSLPAVPMDSLKVKEFNVSSQKSSKEDYNDEENVEDKTSTSDVEYLGEINQKPISSDTYARNYTQNVFAAWNVYYYPFNMFPSTPFDQQITSLYANTLEANKGLTKIESMGNFSLGGGDGRLFHNELGGNFKSEQFTIVILSYKRDSILSDLIEKYVKLPFLHSIIIVWNALDVKISQVFVKLLLYSSCN